FHRYRFVGVPIGIEAAGHLLADPAHAEDIDILEVPRTEGKVFVTDVAPAGDEHLAVHDHQLVVHAVVDATELADLAEVFQHLAAQGNGIEQPDLDVRMMVKGGDVEVPQTTADVIQQQPHPHAPVGRIEQALGDEAAGDIAAVDVVLHVEAVVGPVDHCQARGERGGAGLHQAETGRPATALRLVGADGPADFRVGVRRHGKARRLILLRQRAGTPGQHHQCADQPCRLPSTYL